MQKYILNIKCWTFKDFLFY